MAIRAIYTLEEPRRVQSPFIMERTREQVRTVEREQQIPHERIRRMLDAAADPDNYLHHIYKHRLGNLTFEFRLNRTAVALHNVVRL